MAEKFRHIRRFMDAYIVTMIVVIVFCMAGVAMKGSDLQAGRFFLAAGAAFPCLILVLKLRSRENDAINRNEVVQGTQQRIEEKLDTVSRQTNGKMIAEVRAAERYQLLNDEAYLDRVAEKVAEKMPKCEDVALAAARTVLRLERERRGEGAGG